MIQNTYTKLTDTAQDIEETHALLDLQLNAKCASQQIHKGISKSTRQLN